MKEKPCPFCGGTNLEMGVDMQGWAYIGCRSCEARGPVIRPRLKCRPDENDKIEAMKEWNNRTT